MIARGYFMWMFTILCVVLGVVVASQTGTAGVATAAEDPPRRPPPGPLGCMGTPGQWQGCRGDGCAVCSELVVLYPLYWENHPECTPNDTCGGQYYTCNEACPEPTPADYCNGTPGQWAGCRGNGCAVCVELVAGYDIYFDNHPTCIPNETCGGLSFTCNERCPEPTADDICDRTPGDVNLNGIVCEIGDVVLLQSFLACQTSLTADQIGNSDVNGDCMVDQSDADWLLDCLSGGPDPLDCVCQDPEVTACRCSSPGDVNLNGMVCEVGDVVLLQNFLACQTDLTAEQLTNSDVNGDCVVDNDDGDYLLDCLGGGPDPLPCVCGEPAVDECRCTMPGDVNLNGLVCEIGDAVLLQNFLGCQTGLTPEQIANSDVNGDCMVDNADGDYLLDCVGGGPDPLPCVCAEPEVTACRCSTPGDVNLNGLVCEVGDAVLLQNFLGCLTDLTAEQITNSDVNGDCLVDEADGNYLLDCLSGGPDPLACVCGEPPVDACRCAVPGDTNGNGIVAEIGDVIYLGNFLCSGGPAPDPLANGNVDGDCDVDMDDYYELLDIVVWGGDPAPCVCPILQVIYCN